MEPAVLRQMQYRPTEEVLSTRRIQVRILQDSTVELTTDQILLSSIITRIQFSLIAELYPWLRYPDVEVELDGSIYRVTGKIKNNRRSATFICEPKRD